MGLFFNFFNNINEKQARNKVQNLYAEITTSVAELQEKHPGEFVFSEYVRRALEQRPNWKRIDKQTFRHAQFGNTEDIKIQDFDTKDSAITKIVVAELENASRRLSGKQREKLLQIGLDELEKLLH